jgi:hypothetical protein
MTPESDSALQGKSVGSATKELPRDEALHLEAPEALLGLVTFPWTVAHTKAPTYLEPYLKAMFGSGPGRFNQGNKALASHGISKAQCLQGLEGLELQTPEQKALCGAEYMVPVYKGGRPETAAFCIDIFEFPNKPCELPMVWTAPSAAAAVCAWQGKRLCAQEEWNLACRGDPAGGPDQIYAYGNELDLHICNASKPHEFSDGRRVCNVHDAQKAWATCSTDTEPAGSFPKCRSRFGVFDQHGNVAEVMTRMDREKGLVSQLKGSAFFYETVARPHNVPQDPKSGRETYPDHCNYDPRWHVEPIQQAAHVNYHLGFRCCKNIKRPR